MFSSTLSALRRQATQRNVNKALSSWFSSSRNTYATEATFETKPFRLHKLDEGPSTSATVNKEDAIRMYREMQIIRRMETAAGNLYKEKIIRGFCHLSSGQEACAVGMKAAMRPQDAIITAYRAHGWTYLMGVDVLGVMSELTGRHSGCARGKGGSMHMYSHNFYGGNGIVGAQIPLGAGIAFAAKYLGTGGVCLALYGDGAANQGQVFEVDGMDVLAVRQATEFAINHCTSGKGPIVMEAFTYRYSGHSMSDPGTSYRTREEVQEVRQTRDPITSFRERIVSSGMATPDELKKLEQEIRREVDEATKRSKQDAEIGMDELTADVYSNPLEDKIRGIAPWEQLPHKRLGPAVNLK
ncbi:hypothetical protein J437_LFUL000757 [Ladona fulva]|uniref:Dehydrogenase E1 component domain-containing protein n=1 Tax=Ladona fulva TaxID=123851 RepID=A0A8K0KSE6_LADFU|nr:hypothetical protein J437_LFUL000757 [Ladona fulva]